MQGVHSQVVKVLSCLGVIKGLCHLSALRSPDASPSLCPCNSYLLGVLTTGDLGIS